MTPYHAKYIALSLSQSTARTDASRLAGTLSDAQVDLNPHQIEAALFAFQSPFSKGIILGDEVGLGKTIEAGIVIAQKWAEQKRCILIVVPASLRHQWQIELHDKFDLPAMIIDGQSFRECGDTGQTNPFEQTQIVITSYHFANAKAEFIRAIRWDMAVLDEAHQLRNVYKTENVIATTLHAALGDCFKLLLTASPLQNSLIELYGLTSFIDDHIFGDLDSFKAQYIGIREDNYTFDDLVSRIHTICTRTLRRQVMEYIRYTERQLITQEFEPLPEEQLLYDKLQVYLWRDSLWALPSGSRRLVSMILWKQLASSTFAVAGTLRLFIDRLNTMLSTGMRAALMGEKAIAGILADYEDMDSLFAPAESRYLTEQERESIKAEIGELNECLAIASGITHNAKGEALLLAVDKGFAQLKRLKAPQKAVIFTESRRTHDYLARLLDERFVGKVAQFHGGLNAQQRQQVLSAFRDEAQIMLATEAGAEGLNLQFCAMVINYDLPFNPQRIEQRIGRCHRYGQKHDVVVLNFLNQRNLADQRIYELLREKFHLFEGVFGASEGVLGTLDGLDFEKRVVEIYQQCRNVREIEAAFDALRESLKPQIDERMGLVRRKLLENFDEDVTARFRLTARDNLATLNRIDGMLWALTRYFLRGDASFTENSFFLNKNPFHDFAPAKMNYYFDRSALRSQRYRLNHPIAQRMLFDVCYNWHMLPGEVTFDLTGHAGKISMLQSLVGKRGIMALYQLTMTGLERETHLVCVGMDDSGVEVSPEACARLWSLDGACDINAHMREDLKRDLKAKAISNAEYDAAIERAERIVPEVDADKLRELYERQKVALLYEAAKRHAKYVADETTKLDKWARDTKQSLDKGVKALDTAIADLKAQTRKTAKLQEKLEFQRQLKGLETKRGELSMSLYTKQTEVDEKKQTMVDALRAQLRQDMRDESVFAIRWKML